MKKLFLFLIMVTAVVWSRGQAYHVGDLYTAPDGTQGIVFHVKPDGSGWAVALHDTPTGSKWGNLQDVPNIPNYGEDLSSLYGYNPLLVIGDTAGYSNTMAILNSSQNVQSAAQVIIDISDIWYLPSVGQLCMLYAQLPNIEASLVEAGGSLMKTSLGATYWSSSEKNAEEAWLVNFSKINTSSGGFTYTHSSEISPEYKGHNRLVRAICSFPPPNNYYDTTLTYLWNTSSTEPQIQDVPLQNTTYSVTVTNGYGCTNTSSGSVIVLDNGPQTLYDTICQGATYDNYGFSLSAEETAHAGELTRTRTVTTDACESEITLFLLVAPSDTVYLEKTVYLSYVWNGITYNESGNYTQYFNTFAGCDSVVILQLTITDELPSEDDSGNLVIYLPNAITPSRSDGHNDYFYLPEYYHPFINDFEINIFNRWGNLIYYSTDKNFKWYGEYEGKTFYDVVYSYLIRYRDYIGKTHLLKGTITVL